MRGFRSTECLLHLHDWPTLENKFSVQQHCSYIETQEMTRREEPGLVIIRITLTNFVACIKSWILGYCIVNTENPYSLQLAFQNSSPNHALFFHSINYQKNSDIQVKN